VIKTLHLQKEYKLRNIFQSKTHSFHTAQQSDKQREKRKFCLAQRNYKTCLKAKAGTQPCSKQKPLMVCSNICHRTRKYKLSMTKQLNQSLFPYAYNAMKTKSFLPPAPTMDCP